MARLLIVAGGADYAHDFPDTGAAVAAILADAGHDIVARVAHPDEIAPALEATRPDGVVTHMLWWRMLAERYAVWRGEWAYETSDALRTALPAFVAAGGGLVALHTSIISFDDWPGWGDVLGGRWVWEQSFHPPLGPVTVRVTGGDHEITASIGDFATDDEVYARMECHPGIEVLAVGSHPDGSEHPVLWTWRYGAGRAVHLGLGHDRAALGHPATTALMVRSVAWAVPSDAPSSVR